jgi:MOSC domain-containing protein YiiM
MMGASKVGLVMFLPGCWMGSFGRNWKVSTTMKLLSINVAQPKVIVSNGKSVETGIFKMPVAGRVHVGWQNIEGDRQADLSVHGGPDKAVYAYSWENVLYWQQILRRNDLRPGTFGENLTVEGLPEQEVAIGDELEVGSARFRVTQPRFPCYKLGIALGIENFDKTFQASGRTGFYLRVLQEGSLEAGERITLIGNHETVRVTIAEFATLVRTRRVTKEQLQRVLALQALPPSRRSWVEKKLKRS